MNREDIADYFDVALSTSLIVLAFDGEILRVMIEKRQQEPFKGAWQLPSRYVLPDESIELVAKKLMEDTVNAPVTKDTYIEQLNAFAKVYRNPLGRVVNIAYYCLIKLEEGNRLKGPNVQWAPYNEIPDLAFDHNEMVNYAKERLKRRVKRRPVGFNLLPEEFTLTQLQTLYENALNKKFDKRNFRKKIFNSELLVDIDKTVEKNGKVSRLYRFDEDKYEKMSLKGYDFLF